MGLIKALTSSTSSAFGDQFKEFVTCPTIEKNVLIVKGNVNHGSGNKNYQEGVLSNGTKIAVPEGMAMMIIDNGAIKEFTAEPGEYTFDTSSESSIFTGGLGKGIIDTFKTIGRRFTYGGQTARDQRVYYVNLLNITGNKFGSPQPKKITDDKYGMLEVTFFGEYAFQVIDPIVLVHNVIGSNPKDLLTYEDIIGSQLKGKFIEKITSAITQVMRKHKIPSGDIGMYGSDISDEMNRILDDSWKQQYGLVITDVALQDINLTEESMKRVNKIDDAMIFSNASMQSGLMANATAEAMQNAASNEAGAMVGFMGMNMANGVGTGVLGAVNQNPVEPINTQTAPVKEPGTLFQTNQQTTQPTETKVEENQPKMNFCPQCGAKATGNFCSQCGTKLQ